MVRILQKPDYVEIRLEPAELLDKVFLVPENAPPVRRFFVTDVIRTVAWQLFREHGCKVMEKKKFSYDDVEFLEGKYVIKFYHGSTSKEPGPA